MTPAEITVTVPRASGRCSVSDRMSVITHWIATAPPEDGDMPTMVARDEAHAERLRSNGWVVEGPFIPADDFRGAVDPLWLTSNDAFEIAYRGARACGVGKMSPAQLTAALNALAEHLGGR